MICPNCNKNVADDKEFCDSCGSALFGPKSILLNEPELNNSMNKNNISSITGIDINSISNNSSVYTPFTNNMNSQETGADNHKKNKKVDVKLIVMIIMLIVIGLLISYIMFFNGKTNCPDTPQKECPTCPTVDCKNNSTNSYVVSTSPWSFELPQGAIYTETNGYVHIRSNSLTMRVYPVSTGSVDKITSASYKNMYSAYSNVNAIEDVINNHKLILVTYDTGGAFYVSFYYQLDGGKLLYGEANSLVEKDITSQTLKSIIGSFVPKDANPSFNYEASGFDFSSVLSMLK